MDAKHFLTSKTLWFNVLAFGWKFIGPKVGIPELDDQTFTAIITVANIALRIITKKPLTIAQQ